MIISCGVKKILGRCPNHDKPYIGKKFGWTNLKLSNLHKSAHISQKDA